MASAIVSLEVAPESEVGAKPAPAPETGLEKVRLRKRVVAGKDTRRKAGMFHNFGVRTDNRTMQRRYTDSGCKKSMDRMMQDTTVSNSRGNVAGCHLDNLLQGTGTSSCQARIDR